MACIDKIAADVLNSCETIPRGGFETVAWAINRDDIDTVTYDSTYDTLVEDITMKTGTSAYTVTAVKKEMNAGFDLVTGDDIPDTYLNYFSFKPYEKTAEAVTNLDSMNDLVIIAELKGLKTEGCFVIYGLEKGLYKNSGAQRQNDSNGLPIYEMQSLEGQGERYSRFVFWDTDYSTTQGLIAALLLGPDILTAFVNGGTFPFSTFSWAASVLACAKPAQPAFEGCASNDLGAVILGDKFQIGCVLTLNSGAAPQIMLVDTQTGYASIESNTEILVPGVNVFDLTRISANAANYLQVRPSDVQVTDFTLTIVSIKKYP